MLQEYSAKKEVVARSLRLSGVLGFLLMTANFNKELASAGSLGLGALPVPVCISLGISLCFAIFGQYFLKCQIKAKKALLADGR